MRHTISYALGHAVIAVMAISTLVLLVPLALQLHASPLGVQHVTGAAALLVLASRLLRVRRGVKRTLMLTASIASPSIKAIAWVAGLVGLYSSAI